MLVALLRVRSTLNHFPKQLPFLQTTKFHSCIMAQDSKDAKGDKKADKLIKVGDKVPNVALFEGTPKDKIMIGELLADKSKAIVFGVPGAFTPGCSKTHLPGYITDFDSFQKKGVDLIVCTSVNDPFVMAAWGEAQGAAGKVRMLADTTAEFAKALGVDFDKTAVLGGIRSKRYSMLVEKGVVTKFNLESDGGGLTCSLSNKLLEAI